MALGEQFENTYWFSDGDKFNTSLVRRTPEVDVSRGPQLTSYGSYDQIQHADIRSYGNDIEPANALDIAVGLKFDADEPLNKLGEDRPAVQGMLFSPYVGTGLQQDPLVPEGAREDAARRALKLEDTPENLEKYKAAVKSARLGTVGDKAARAHQQIAVDSLVSSTMPIQEMERMAELGTAGTLVKPTSGRAFFDSGSVDGGRIVLNRDTVTGSRTVETPPRIERKTTRGEPTPNPKFWDWHDRVAPSSGSVAFVEDLASTIYDEDSGVVWSHPETGDVLPRGVDELNSHPVFSDLDKPFSPGKFPRIRKVDISHAWNVTEALRNAGYVANVYPGKAKEMKVPTHTKDVKFTGDMSMRSPGDYNTISAHVRHTPGSVEEVEIPGETKTEWYKRPIISGGSMTTVHEMGHAKDAARLRGGDRDFHLGGVFKLDRDGYITGRYGYADPIAEGAADGYADMYGAGGGRLFGNKNLLQSAIADPTFAGTHHTRTGYRTEYGNFKTNTHRALYAAVRAHVGMGGSFDDIPDRSIIRSTPELRMDERLRGVQRHVSGSDNMVGVEMSHAVNEATLGHMWESMPHVREHLTTLGYDRIAREAAKVNQQHREQWTRDNVGEQLSFDDL